MLPSFLNEKKKKKKKKNVHNAVWHFSCFFFFFFFFCFFVVVVVFFFFSFKFVPWSKSKIEWFGMVNQGQFISYRWFRALENQCIQWLSQWSGYSLTHIWAHHGSRNELLFFNQKVLIIFLFLKDGYSLDPRRVTSNTQYKFCMRNKKKICVYPLLSGAVHSYLKELP